MRRTVFASSFALIFPLVGCGTVQLSGEPLGPGSCKRLEANPDGSLPPLLSYYNEAEREAGSGARSFGPDGALARENAFTGEAPWLRPHEAPKPLSRVARAEFADALGVDSNTISSAMVPDPGRKAALVLWNHLGSLTPTAAIAERVVATAPTSQSPTPVALAKLSARDRWESEVAEAIQAGGDDALATLTAQEATYARSLEEFASTPESRKLSLQRQQEATTGKFIQTYFKAYFRGGHLFQANLKTDDLATNAVDAVIKKLGKTLDPKDRQALIDELKAKLQGICNKDSAGTDCLLTAALGLDAFISRSGTTIQFQGVTLGVGFSGGVKASLDYPRGKDFGPQIVRVLMEATFDSRIPYVPAADTSTACTTHLYGVDRCLSASTANKYDGLLKVVTAVDEKAARADSMTGVATGTLIRSFGIVALNNEAAADTIESLTAVIARKITERAAWRQTYTQKCAVPPTTTQPPAALHVSK